MVMAMTGEISRRTFLKAAAAAVGAYGIGGLDEESLYNGDSLGKAYGFFDAPVPGYDISKELPAIRDAVQTPRDLDIILRDGNASQVRDPAQATGSFRYVLEASYQGHSNAEAARELADIFNQAVHTDLYQEPTTFRGRVAYHEAGQWKHVDEEGLFSKPQELL